MNIIITKTILNDTEINSVNARDLHTALDSKQEFSNWIKKRLDETMADENIDYTSFDKIIKREIGATKVKDYIISLDLAKEIAMLERNEKGKEIRKYFIECEKKLNSPNNTLDYLQMQLNALKEQERRVSQVENKTENLHKEQLKLSHNINRVLSNDNYMTIIAYANLKGIKAKDYHAPSLGRKATKISNELGLPTGAVIDPRFGKIKTYSTEVLSTIF